MQVSKPITKIEAKKGKLSTHVDNMGIIHMQYFYKKVKVAMPHCGRCGEQLSGNNSDFSPYQCSCGIWKAKDWNNPHDFVLVQEDPLTLH